MQTLLTVLIVLGAVTYMARQWMPAPWRAKDRAKPLPLAPSTTACGACNTCGACAKS